MDILKRKSDISAEEGIMIPIITEESFDDDYNDFQIDDKKDILPVIPLRNMVLFPSVVVPISAGRAKTLSLVKRAIATNKQVCVIMQRDRSVEDPGMDDLYHVGVIANVLKVIEISDEHTTVVLQGRRKCRLNKITQMNPFLKGHVSLLEETLPDEDDQEFVALMSAIKEQTIRMIKAADNIPNEMTVAVDNITSPSVLINFICCNVYQGDGEQKQMLLEEENLKQKAFMLLEKINHEIQIYDLKNLIQNKVKGDIDQQQREYFLQQQIKTLQDELGGSASDQEIEEMRNKSHQKLWSKSVGQAFDKELQKLERTSPQSGDYPMQMNYVQTILNLPWGEYSTDNFDLKKAQKVLDRDHFGLEKVKERIIEHLAVLKLKGDLKSPIICLYGPPGVGKTSLGKSVAEALGRKYVRISLGGLHDESEIRGHRRTYIGAMLGRILQGIQKAGTSNPVFVLDEIDKVGSDHRGDPSSALLEVLDPEQNTAFHDNYLDIDYDLSKVMFIATANNIGSISQPLLDRMELIEVSGYIEEEKVEIASRHLVKKEMEAHGITKNNFSMPKSLLPKLINGYTRESGVRELDKQIAKIMRKVAKEVADSEFSFVSMNERILREFLGPRRYTHDSYQGNQYAGVVTGLAWTSVGGEILFIESSISKGIAGKLTLTGNLGDVMKESAVLALEYIKAHSWELQLDDEVFNRWNLHVHVPEGAIPKDGPSAGITMVTSIASAFTQRRVKPYLAMTGEITLRGKVLPVGGIKEKILAAKRAGIKEIILSKDNVKDVVEINEKYLFGLEFHYVESIMEVLDIALLKEKVAKPISLDYYKTDKKEDHR